MKRQNGEELNGQQKVKKSKLDLPTSEPNGPELNRNNVWSKVEKRKRKKEAKVEAAKVDVSSLS